MGDNEKVKTQAIYRFLTSTSILAFSPECIVGAAFGGYEKPHRHWGGAQGV